MHRRFDGKSVLVTGASQAQGIGACAARRFAAEGARVAVAARSAEGLQAVVDEIRQAGGEASAFPTDVSDLKACEALIRDVVAAHDGLDVLVNNAGFNARGEVADMPWGELAAIIQVNLLAPVVLTRCALPQLRERCGAVVQVASIAGQIPLESEAAYSASKIGLRTFSFALREELEGTGVRVSVLSPGPVSTGFILDDLDKVPDLVFAQPMSSPERIADAVLDCAVDGPRERSIPARSSFMARAGALFPSLRHAVTPLLEKQGRTAKAAWRARAKRDVPA